MCRLGLVQLLHAMGDADGGVTLTSSYRLVSDDTATSTSASVVSGASSSTSGAKKSKKSGTEKMKAAGVDVVASDTVYGAAVVDDVNASNILAMACDSNASPTVQHVLGVSMASVPHTAKYLFRRFIGWGLEAMAAAEVEGISDVEHGLGSSVATAAAAAATSGSKRKRADARAALANPFTRDASVDEVVPMDVGTSTHNYLEALCNDAIGSRLVEFVVTHGDTPLVSACFTVFFAGNLRQLAMSPSANFVVQRLACSCRTLSQTAAVVAELLPAMGDLVKAGREGIIWHLVAAAAGGNSLQAGSDAAATLAAGGAPGGA
ncbi:hypothetical protein EON66_12100, partial [archaeon]